MEKFTLVLHEGEKAYKFSKIAFYGDGGFCIFAPYHSSKKGLLCKLKVDYRLREQNIGMDQNTEYTADDKVKLSIHPDGFVQFSGVNKNNIISGRDQVTKEPKGLGIVSNPLNKVIQSGPTFGSTIWGINKFDQYIQPKKDEQVIEFVETDYYYRNCTKEDWNAYALEGFLFEHDAIQHIKEINGNQLLAIKHFNYEIPGNVFVHKIVPYYPEDYIVGLLVSRIKVNFESDSGFILSSPSQLINKNIGNILIAMYPPDPKMIMPQQSLNYNPEK